MGPMFFNILIVQGTKNGKTFIWSGALVLYMMIKHKRPMRHDSIPPLLLTAAICYVSNSLPALYISQDI